jgi:RNA recognition motif-containing protein
MYDILTGLFRKSVSLPQRAFRLKNGKVIYKPRGYGFVTFDDEQKDLDSIISKFTDSEFKGRKIYLSHPKEKEPEENKDASADENKEPETEAKEEKKPQDSKPKKTKVKKSAKTRLPFDQGIKSIDTLHVKNLDFTIKRADLREFFTAEGETPKWISVPFWKSPRAVLKRLEAEGKPVEKKNKGYAFVNLELKEGETLDDKVEKFQGKLLKERELQVSVAIDVRPKEEEESKEENKTLEKVEDEGDDKVDDKVDDVVDDVVEDKVEDIVEDKVEENVEEKVEDNVEDNFEDNVEESVEETK